MRRATFDRWPANVSDPSGGPGWTRVRVLVADDGHAWIISEQGDTLLEVEGAGAVSHHREEATVEGPGWVVTNYSGCNCNGEASRTAARALLNREDAST